MNHATVTTNGLTPILAEAFITQDFDEIRVGCP